GVASLAPRYSRPYIEWIRRGASAPDQAGSLGQPKPQRAQTLAHSRVSQQLAERADRGTIEPRLGHDEVVALLLHRNEPQPVLPRDRIDGHPPVRAPLAHGRCDRVVRLGLDAVARRPAVPEQL